LADLGHAILHKGLAACCFLLGKSRWNVPLLYGDGAEEEREILFRRLAINAKVVAREAKSETGTIFRFISLHAAAISAAKNGACPRF
jgi:hypothetical protein